MKNEKFQFKDRNDAVIQWLLESGDPSIRYLTLTEILDEQKKSPEVKKAKKDIPNGPLVRRLLSGQKSDGGFGVHPYQKWTGAHWRLVSLVELGIPPDHPKALAAANQVLEWLTSDDHLRGIKKIHGLTRQHASVEGNALAVCCRLGLAKDVRVRQIAHSLMDGQWHDGGWNCDEREEAHHSSFYESLASLWGLIEYHRATGDKDCLKSAQRASEFFLRHRLIRSEKTGEVINPHWLKLHYPLYWHYDILQALRILSLLDKLRDPRVEESLDILESKRLRDGRWQPGGYYWYPGGRVRIMGKKRILSNVEVVNWGRNGPNRMITLIALRVLKSAGRF